MRKLENNANRRKILLRIDENIYKVIKKYAEWQNKSITLAINELLNSGYYYETGKRIPCVRKYLHSEELETSIVGDSGTKYTACSIGISLWWFENEVLISHSTLDHEFTQKELDSFVKEKVEEIEKFKVKKEL